MTAATETRATTEPMTTYRIRLPKADVDGVKRLALSESVSRGEQIGWCELLRAALHKMSAEQTPIS